MTETMQRNLLRPLDALALLKKLGPRPWSTSPEAHAQARLIADFEDNLLAAPCNVYIKTTRSVREWCDLTDEEKDVVVCSVPGMQSLDEKTFCIAYDFAEAMLAALKEKNHG